jgi:cyanate lyase
MTALNKQELQIIQVFSSVDVPERIIRDSNIKELIHGMTAEQDAVQSDARRLESLRGEKKDGNFIGNWWNDRDDKVQDAQIDLNKSIGRLTQKSSQLLIVNTAISKVLNDQQRILLEQQHILKRQTDTLEEQNRKILEQQKLLEKQQQDINKANQGLMEAKGVTQEQAQQLVGCVKLVQEAESRISSAHQDFRSGVEQYLHDSVERCLSRLNSGFAEQEQRYDGFEQQLTTSFSTQSQNAKAELARIASDTADFKTDIRLQQQAHIQTVLEKVAAQDATALQLHEAVNSIEQKQKTVLNEQKQGLKAVEFQLAAMQAEQQKGSKRNRLAMCVVATLALLSLGWQVAQHFALV